MRYTSRRSLPRCGRAEQYLDGADVRSSCSNFSQGSTWKAKLELARPQLRRREIRQKRSFDQILELSPRFMG